MQSTYYELVLSCLGQRSPVFYQKSLSVTAPFGLPVEVATDPARSALMENLRTSGGKRRLRPVPRREKKVSNFMDTLRSEAKAAKGETVV